MDVTNLVAISAGQASPLRVAHMNHLSRISFYLSLSKKTSSPPHSPIFRTRINTPFLFFFFFLPHSFTRQQNKREKSIYTKNFLYVRINGKLARIESNRNPSCSPLKLKRFNVSPLFSSSCRVVEESSER